MDITTAAIQIKPEALAPRLRTSRLPALPWRDPHSVPQEQLEEFIGRLREACALNPENADMRTCLGIAYATNYDVYRSMDALEEARASFRMRQNAVNKLDHLVTQQAALTSLQQAGLTEAADEEQSCGRPVPPASGN